MATTAERIRYLRRIVRRETIRLVLLTVIACVAFWATRALAREAEHAELQDAAAWYERGQQHLAAGNPEQAAVAFRRATMKHRGEKRYVLALAEALGRSGNREPAVRALLGLREFSPEDVEVNLSLARLARARGDVAEAVRYYQHAIYAPASTVASSRDVRLELVELLLDSGQNARAVSELIAASVDAPDDPTTQLLLGDLFLRADAAARAAQQYQTVLDAEPQNVRALEGAVRAAFALGEYRRVARFQLPATAAGEAQSQVAIAREVVARDPLAGRLSAAERRRRLLVNVAHLEGRWSTCSPGAALPPELTELRKAAQSATIGRDTEALESALTTLDAMRRQIEPSCAERLPADRAIEIIAALHDVAAS